MQLIEPGLKNLEETKEAYEYQKTTLKFAEDSNFNFLCGHAMGLGKTIIGALALRNHASDLLPALIPVKSAVTYNWGRELCEWVFGKEDPLAYYVIQGKMPFIPIGFKTYIISHDSLALNMEHTIKYDKGIQGEIKGPLFELGLKSIIVDECQAFKDDKAKRTKALMALVKGAQIKHKIFMSGTPIKSKADELFVPLHLLHPEEFGSRKRFRDLWLERDSKGRWANLNRYRAERFHEKISKYYIRYEKTEVQKNLPPFRRESQLIEIEDQYLRQSYNAQLKQFKFLFEGGIPMSSFSILGELAKLRRITGMAKVPYAVEWAEEFFESAALDKMIDPSYPDKLAIGIHHKDVRQHLKARFDQRDAQMADEKPAVNALTLSGEDDAWDKQQIIDKFSSDKSRLLILNSLAGGVGLNIQACANFIVLERQWNSQDEEQFESRFHRDGQKYPVLGTYLNARGTIDQWFDELVERSREVFRKTIRQEICMKCAHHKSSHKTGPCDEGDCACKFYMPPVFSYELTSNAEGIRELAEKTLQNPL